MNVNFKESSENVQDQEKSCNKETTFYLGSESENDENEAKTTVKKDNKSSNQTDSMNLSSNQPQVLEESLVRNDPDSQVLAKKSTMHSFVFSSSESDSESSTSSSSSTSSNKSKKLESEVFNTKDLFGSELSDEESDLVEDKSVDITNIQDEYAKIEQDENKENENFENITELSTSQCLDIVSHNILDDMIDLSITEQLILELIFDKILDEEIGLSNSLTPNMLRSVCIWFIETEKIEKQKLEEKVRNEIKNKVEEEICEKIFNEKFDELIHECSQRVLAETKNEQIESIFGSIVDQVCTDNIENCMIDFIIDDMTCVSKPLLEKIECKIEKDLKNRSNNKRPFPGDFSQIQERGKRSRTESDGSESSWKSSLNSRDNDKKTLEECKYIHLIK